MKGKCIKKIFRIISQNEIEFKLAISAILLNFENKDESLNSVLKYKENKDHNESNYILKIIMTSFNPIELTTKLGGPWEGYFVWDVIKGNILNSYDKGDQKNSLLNFLEMMDDESPSENLLSMNLMKYFEYMDKIPNPRPIDNTFEEPTKEKDYILIIKFEGTDSEIILHLRSTFHNNIKDSSTMENINIITCLKEMVELIKLENFNLHENLRNLTELSNNKQVTNNTENDESQYNGNNSEDIKMIDNYNNVINQLSSPNTRGTLELSELRIPSYLNNSQGNNNSKMQDINNSYLIDKQSNKDTNNYVTNNSCNNNNINSKVLNSDLLHNQIKTYRFIKDSFKNGNDQYNGSYSTSSLPAYYSSSFSPSSSSRTNRKNSALRSAIDSVRRTQNDLISRQTSALSNRFNFNNDYDDFYNIQDYAPKYNHTTISSELESDNYSYYKYFQKLNKSRQRQHNYEQPNINNYLINDRNKNNYELKTPNNTRKIIPLYTREQLMKKLSNTKDISERINILKNMIKSTKKESYYIDEFD
ncbi:uncharacterized protein cubi_03686 [Cryptosporidium ubiquitum]|uniref:Uncharacterized protein n=1 Tax=Cryptosporidium ubiquitum TaxID=857276 RepID=A0A1J4MF09_9CRYT|nr:uncharacterized protein cubi_03686 [Cryptosporidium ubiquitum]OII72816.1 hypothetical protein cubi_03686 [Cryptosporidium ubiquitum]